MATGASDLRSDLYLRSLFPGPWGRGSRLESMESKIRQSSDLRLASDLTICK